MGSECLVGDFLLQASKGRRRSARAQEGAAFAVLGCQLEIPLGEDEDGVNNVATHMSATLENRGGEEKKR